MRLIHLVNGGLLILLLLVSIAAWPYLPETIPIHFGVDGQADGWASKSILSWFGIPMLVLATTAFTYLVARFLPRWPGLINLPAKRKFLELPPERQMPVIAHIQDMLYGVSTMVLVLFCVVQTMIFRVAIGESSEGFTMATLLLCLLMTPIILLIWLPRIQREVDYQTKNPAPS